MHVNAQVLSISLAEERLFTSVIFSFSSTGLSASIFPFSENRFSAFQYPIRYGVEALSPLSAARFTYFVQLFSLLHKGVMFVLELETLNVTLSTMREEFATLTTYYRKTRAQSRDFIIQTVNIKNKKDFLGDGRIILFFSFSKIPVGQLVTLSYKYSNW